MVETEIKFTRKTAPERIRRVVETVFGCKWSLTILFAIKSGVNRPGAISRSIDGLSPKVMNYCLNKLLEFSILRKQSYAEIPPRVEYEITDFGNRFIGMFDLLEALSEELERECPADAETS